MSQKKLIRNALVNGKKVSQLSVLRDFGCMRLADVIWHLRKDGFTIKREWRTSKHGGRYAVYTLDRCGSGGHVFRMVNYVEVCKFCGEIGRERPKGKKRHLTPVATSGEGHSSVSVDASVSPVPSLDASTLLSKVYFAK